MSEKIKYKNVKTELFLKIPVCPFCETDSIEYINESSKKISGFELFGTDKYEHRYYYRCKNCEKQFSTNNQLTLDPIMIVDGKEKDLRLYTNYHVRI